jgi:hypothetical protein
LYSNDLATKGKAHLEKKNISFTNDGMKVGVKEVKTEDYEDSTQRYNRFETMGIGTI